MPNKIKASEMRLIDDLFEMGGGYVLDFSNRTFSEFFDDELNINIDDPQYDAEGTSKAKRLRYFLKSSQNNDRVRVLLALWEYRETNLRRAGLEDSLPHHREDFAALIKSWGGVPPDISTNRTSTSEAASFDESRAEELHRQLIELSALDPHPRGFAFEKFLKGVFDANNLAARASFRLVGEQIDGSFVLDAETYLLEAKWVSAPVGVADLRSFNAKVEDKATWSRGLFISNSGFSEDGLGAFGRGNSIVCMDGLDLSDMLQRRIAISDLIHRKVRRCAETGKPFVRLRGLY